MPNSDPHHHGGKTMREMILSLHRGEVDAAGQHLLAHALDVLVPRPLLGIDPMLVARMETESPETDVLTEEVLAVDHELTRVREAATRGDRGGRVPD